MRIKLIDEFFKLFRITPEEDEIIRTVIPEENIRRVLYLSLIAIPASLLYMIIFNLKDGETTGTIHQWRTAISSSHTAIFITFVTISILLYFFSFKPGKNNLIARISINATIIVLFLAGSAITAADQLVTTAITPFMIVCLAIGLILLIPPLQATVYFTAAYIVFYFSISVTQANREVLVSNQINGVTAIAAGLCLSFILWRSHMIRTRQSRQIERQTNKLRNAIGLLRTQKNQIESAHEQITASIEYAKYIQLSVLPKAEELESGLGEYFILHLPVEIISGDFYWISSSGDKTIVAVADCTGHGVPAAFMSMLGMTLLDEIINKERITEPGLILDRLREEVTNSLKQKGERWEQKDGMDIAICTIDYSKMKMQFAGANNPLYLIRKRRQAGSENSPEQPGSSWDLIDVKGDSMPIGIADEMTEFQSTELDLATGDSLYLFTDGFPDQFGGPDHKKFSYLRFKELLIRTSEVNMRLQKSMIEESLTNWMGNWGQTDDILILGFRIN